MLTVKTYVEENIDQLEEEEIDEEGPKKSHIIEKESPVHPPPMIVSNPNKEKEKEKETREMK